MVEERSRQTLSDTTRPTVCVFSNSLFRAGELPNWGPEGEWITLTTLS